MLISLINISIFKPLEDFNHQFSQKITKGYLGIGWALVEHGWVEHGWGVHGGAKNHSNEYSKGFKMILVMINPIFST